MLALPTIWLSTPKTHKYQVYGFDELDKLTHAGVWPASSACLLEAQRIEKIWGQWRDKYLTDNPSAKTCPIGRTRPTSQLAMHPLGVPEAIQWFNI